MDRRDLKSQSRSLTPAYSSRHVNLIPENFHIALQVAAECTSSNCYLKVDGITYRLLGAALLAAEGAIPIVPSLNCSLLLIMLTLLKDITPLYLLLACNMGYVSIVRQLLARNDVDFDVIVHTQPPTL
jgi:hypothetical protein